MLNYRYRPKRSKASSLDFDDDYAQKELDFHNRAMLNCALTTKSKAPVIHGKKRKSKNNNSLPLYHVSWAI